MRQNAVLRTNSTSPNSLPHLVLTLVPVLACLGALVSVGGSALFGFRIAAALLLVLAMLQHDKIATLTGLRALVLLLCYVWVLVAVALMMVHGINDDAWSELASLTAGVALLVAISTLNDVAGSISAISKGWLIAYFVTAYFGARELIWGKTLPNYYQPDQIDPIGAGYGIASTLGNPNAYAFFLVASIPIFVLGLSRSPSWAARLAFVVALLTLPMLLNGTGSRTGLVLAAFIGVVLVIFLLRIRSATIIGFSSVVVVASSTLFLMVAAAYGLGGENGGILHRLDSAIMSVLLEDSVVARWMLVRNGIDMAMDAQMMGWGPGGFEAQMELGAQRFSTMGNVNPHNGFIEILSQYGVLVFLLFSLLLVCVGVVAARAVGLGSKRRRMAEGHVAIVLAVALPFLATMNSSFLEPSEAWLLMGTIVAFGISAEQHVLESGVTHEGTLQRGGHR